MQKNTTRVLFGIMFIVAAVIVFGNATGLWYVQNFSGWWTVFLIVPGLAGLISYGYNTGSLILVLLGTWLLARAQGWLPWQLANSLIWVVILLLIGLRLIVGNRRWHPSWNGHAPNDAAVFEGVKGANDTSGTVNYSAIFSSVEVANTSTAFFGGTISAVFGGAVIDLRNAVPVNGAVLEANSVFGGITIFAPQNCRIQVSGAPFLGGCQCTAVRPNDPSLPLLIIRYTSVFYRARHGQKFPIDSYLFLGNLISAKVGLF